MPRQRIVFVGALCFTCLGVSAQAPPAAVPLAGSLFAARYGARCDGVADDTAALTTALHAAQVARAGKLNTLVLPAGICRTSQTLDITGITLEGAGGKANGLTQVGPTTTNPGFDILQTKGQTRLAHLRIVGGWDHTTAGLKGNGLSILSDPAKGYTGYSVSVDDVWIEGVDHDGVYEANGAYNSFHDMRINLVGAHDFEAASFTSPGFQTTSTAFTGQIILSDAPNGFGLLCNACISVSTGGAVVTSENTEGVKLAGDGRNLDLSHFYFEGTLAAPGAAGPKCFTLDGSTGIGLIMSANYGPACAPPSAEELRNWGNVQLAGNDMAGTGVYSTGTTTVIRGFSKASTDPQTEFTTDVFIPGSWTTMNSKSPVAMTSGRAWSADITGAWVDYTARPRPEATIHLSSANPSIRVGDRFTLTCQVTGVFQCMTSNYAAFVNTPEFLGFVRVTQDLSTTNSGVFLSTGDSISVGGVNSSGTVSGATVTSGNGFTGQCAPPHVPLFAHGIATGCSTVP